MSKVYEAAEITEGGSSYSYYDGEMSHILFLPDQYIDLSKKENRDAYFNALRPSWRERIRRRLRAAWRWLWV